MDTFGVKKELILKCLSFRNDMLSYLDTRHATDFSDEFCSKVTGIYDIFGVSVKDINVDDFVCFGRGIYPPRKITSNYMFPVYDGFRNFSYVESSKKIAKTMNPVWGKVRDSNDLSLLLNHRHENPIFDEVLFVLIMIGAWKFGDFIKMCGDIGIITDRLYEKKGEEGERRVNGYPCLPFVGKNLSLNGILVKSYIGSICSETSVDEVVKYDKCFPEIWYLMKLRREKLNFEDIMLHGVDSQEWDIRYSKRLSCKPACNLLKASLRVENTNFRWLLQLLSLKDVTRMKVGIRHGDEYDKGIIDTKLMSWCYIADGGLLSEMTVSEIRDGRETRVTLK